MAKFKSPLHITRMKIIHKYDTDTQLKMKKSIIDNYCDTINSLSDSLRQFNDMDMTTHFLKREHEVLKEWSKGLEGFLNEWENKYEK
jgi:hypothetical protein